MKDWMERFAMLPFSIGCASQSSVDVVLVDTSQPAAAAAEAKKPKSSSSSSETKPPLAKERDQEILPKERTKNSISGGIQKLVRSIKSLVQVFVYKEEDEEREEEMEIGYPTDVKHVTHIGLDGTTTTNPVKGWENLKAPEIVSFPAISLKQFELAMAAQAHQQSDLLADPNSKLGLKK